MIPIAFNHLAYINCALPKELQVMSWNKYGQESTLMIAMHMSINAFLGRKKSIFKDRPELVGLILIRVFAEN